MQAAPGLKRPKPESLGCVGKEAFRRRFAQWFGIRRDGDGKRRFWYKSIALEVDGIPYVLEVAVAQTKRKGQFFHGIELISRKSGGIRCPAARYCYNLLTHSNSGQAREE
jgi:hypothetical protein